MCATLRGVDGMSPLSDDAITNSSSESSPGLEELFEWHPRYRGMRFIDVFRAIIDEANLDQMTYRSLRQQAVVSEADVQLINTLDDKWTPFGGRNWPYRDPVEVARLRVRLEKMRDIGQEMISLEDLERSLARVDKFNSVHRRRESKFDEAAQELLRFLPGYAPIYAWFLILYIVLPIAAIWGIVTILTK